MSIQLPLLRVAMLATLMAGTVGVHADDRSRRDRNDHDDYVVTPLVSDLPGAATQDGVLQNAWGIAFSPAGSPFWVNDNATGCSTLYSGTGTKVALQVSIPLPGGIISPNSCRPVDPNHPATTPSATPTGIIWNPAGSFVVPGTKIAAAFIFATEDGTISAWAGGLSPATNAVLAVDNSATPAAGNGAVYKGLAFGVTPSGPRLYATNFRAGTIDVFGPSNPTTGLFTPTTVSGGFADARIPAGYAPFGIQNIDGDLFVTYAKQDKAKHDDVAGPGNGFVDVFDTDGHLLHRFADRGRLNSPWGIARASFGFGRYSSKILVGNFGDGRINVFNDDGDFLTALENTHDRPIVIDGLWALTPGGGQLSSPDTLYFSAGPHGEADGLFGTITPSATDEE